MKDTLRTAADDFWDMILLNILFVLSCLPLITYGAAIGALYLSVSQLEEKRLNGGAAIMYWRLLKQTVKKATKLWCALLAVIFMVCFNFAILSQMPNAIRYCSYGLQSFVLVLVQVAATVGFPILSKNKCSVIDAVKKSLEVLGKLPCRTLFACFLQVIPFVMIFIAPKIFASLFLLWIVVYFSFSEKLIVVMLEKSIQKGIA